MVSSQEILVGWDWETPEGATIFNEIGFFLLTSSCLGYFIKNLNQTNVTTAFVNGMDEYYGMNKTNTTTFDNVHHRIHYWPNTIEYAFAQDFYQILSWWVGDFWAFLTLIMITVPSHKIKALYALRFLSGFTESAYFPCLSISLVHIIAKTKSVNEVHGLPFLVI